MIRPNERVWVGIDNIKAIYVAVKINKMFKQIKLYEIVQSFTHKIHIYVIKCFGLNLKISFDNSIFSEFC